LGIEPGALELVLVELKRAAWILGFAGAGAELDPWRSVVDRLVPGAKCRLSLVHRAAGRLFSEKGTRDMVIHKVLRF
jgi:hypothetical protein